MPGICWADCRSFQRKSVPGAWLTISATDYMHKHDLEDLTEIGEIGLRLASITQRLIAF
jgi:hypothetical protein